MGGVLSTRRDELPGLRARPRRAGDRRRLRAPRPASPRRRFSATSGVVSALVVQIRASGRQFGGIGVHSRTAQHFSADDAHFLQAIANVIGAAAERARHEEAVRDSEARFRELADTAPALMWMTDARGRRDLRQRGLAALHRPRADGGPGRHVRAERPPGRPRRPAHALARRLRAPHRVPLRVPAHAPQGRAPLGAGGGRPALRRGRVRGLRRHRHGHPRAQADGGRAAQVRGELPRPGRQRAGDDLDDRRPRTGDLRERGLAGVHGHHARAGAGRHLGVRGASRRLPPRSSAAGTRRSSGASCGSASTGCAPRAASTAGSPSAASRATRTATSWATSAPPSTSTCAS